MKNIVQINRKIFLLLMPIALVLLSFQYQKTNDITGKWAFPDSPREIEIYKQSDKYYAKIIKVSGKDEKEKVGHIMLKDLVYYQTDKKYTGEVNSPSGMTASCELVLLDENKLQINLKKFFIINKSYTLTRIK
ncbi:MAG: DUF2147 domain-containing protein [Candidatus Staskawiczbacteria bacterium]|nr:DUF2147 domain-containing protein [Candidatus Staskawiczbacteria bacterium]